MNKNRYISKYHPAANRQHKRRVRNRPYLSGNLWINGFGGRPEIKVRTKADIAEAITVFRHENYIIKEGSVNRYLQKMKKRWPPREQEVSK